MVFAYGSLVWMFCTRTESKRIYRVHERALRIIYDDYSSSFEALLERDGAVTFHVNIRKVAIEMFKVYHGIAPEGISDLFTIAESNITSRGCVVPLYVFESVGCRKMNLW